MGLERFYQKGRVGCCCRDSSNEKSEAGEQFHFGATVVTRLVGLKQLLEQQRRSKRMDVDFIESSWKRGIDTDREGKDAGPKSAGGASGLSQRR